MDIAENQPIGSTGQEAMVTALIGLIISLISFLVIGPFLGLLAAIPFMTGDLTNLIGMLENPVGHPEFRVPMYIMQGVAAAFGLIFTPWLFLKIRKEQPVRQFFSDHKSLLSYLLTIVVVISFMGFNSLIIDWNANMHLPESLSSLEEWAREMEDKGAELTNYLTDIDSTGMFILAFIVIAVIPGIGEEFVFRGILQKKIMDSGLSPHLAIWIGAIIFSAIHLQFFGFFPRMFLGALFGYLYWWSGDLKVPMLAHFANNAFTLIMVTQFDESITPTGMEETDTMPLATVIIMSIITAALLFFLYNYWRRNKKEQNGWQKVYTTEQEYQAEIVKSVLSESMNAVILNKKDSSYKLGYYEIHVRKDDAMRALQIIENDITFQ